MHTELLEKKKLTVVISRGNSYSFSILNLPSTLRDLWKRPTGFRCAVTPFSDDSVAVGLALLSKRLHSVCIYIRSKVFIQNQEHAKGSKWKVSEISHSGWWLRLIQMHLFLESAACLFCGLFPRHKDRKHRDVSLGCCLVYLDALLGPGDFREFSIFWVSFGAPSFY